jgi:PBP1b-binding outer membrane lipoprotein LpoB
MKKAIAAVLILAALLGGCTGSGKQAAGWGAGRHTTVETPYSW